MLCLVINVSDFLATLIACLGVGWQPHNEAQHLNITTKKAGSKNNLVPKGNILPW